VVEGTGAVPFLLFTTSPPRNLTRLVECRHGEGVRRKRTASPLPCFPASIRAQRWGLFPDGDTVVEKLMALSLKSRAGGGTIRRGWGSLWLAVAGLWASGGAAAAEEFAVYDCRAEAVWGHWGRVYEQSFIPPASGRLAYLTFTGAAQRGPFPVTCTLLEAESQQPVAPPQTLTLKDDEGRTVAWPLGETVRLTRGRRYLLRLENPEGWALYVGEGEPVSGSLTLDGEELANRAMLGQVVLDCEPAELRLERVVADTREVILPDTNLSVSLLVTNTGETPAQVLQAGLRFEMEGTKGTKGIKGEKNPTEVTARYFVAPAPGNPRVIYGGETVEFRFHVEAFHDTPEGEVEVGGWVEWYDAADNLIDNAGFEHGSGAPPQEWSRWVDPEGDLHAAFAWDEGLGEALPLAPGLEQEWQQWIGATRSTGADDAPPQSLTMTHQPSTIPPQPSRSLRFTIEDNATEGVMTSDCNPVGVEPAREYVAGVWTKSSDTGLMTSLHKVLVAREFSAVWPQEELVEEHHQTLWEGRFWNPQRMRFVTGEETEYVRLSLRMNAYGTGRRGSVWWDEVYLLPAEALRETGETEQPHRWTVRLTEESYKLADGSWSPVVYLGDDWETQGDWQNSYGEGAHILCGMKTPDDIVGGWYPIVHRPRVCMKDPCCVDGSCGANGNLMLSYDVHTSDPTDGYRIWLGRRSTQDPRALCNPLTETRTYASWDDHGETHPFDYQGADLVVDLSIPPGPHRLALYLVDWDGNDTRAHRLCFLDENGRILQSGKIAQFSSGVYKTFLVDGPLTFTVRISKDESVCAIISGIFLDMVTPPMALPEILTERDAQGGKDLAGVPRTSQQDKLARLAARYTDLCCLADRNWAAYRVQLREYPRLIEALAEMIPEHLSPYDRAVAQWIQWQGYLQIGNIPRAKESAWELAKAISIALPPNTGLTWLLGLAGEAAEAGDVVSSKSLTDACFSVVDATAVQGDVQEQVEGLIAHYVNIDPDYAARKFEQYLDALTSRDDKQTHIAMLKALAQKYAEMGNAALTCVAYRVIIEKYGPSALTVGERLNLAKAYDGRGDYLNAASVYEELLTQGVQLPDRPNTYLAWVNSLLYAGKPDLAKEVSRRLIAEFPEHEAAASARYLLSLLK
jgi:tetratricopeptide (TPR) repeat protein